MDLSNFTNEYYKMLNISRNGFFRIYGIINFFIEEFESEKIEFRMQEEVISFYKDILTVSWTYIYNAWKELKNYLEWNSHYLKYQNLFALKYYNDTQDFNSISYQNLKNINNLIGNLIENKNYDFSKEKFKKSVEEFGGMLNGSKKHLEKEYQKIIEDIIIYLYPGYILTKKSIKTIDNKQKYFDLYLTGISSDVIIELKLPQTKILNESKDRNNFYATSAITKSVMQLVRYKESLEAEYYENEESKEVKAVLIMGNSRDVEKKKNDFTILKKSFSSVEIYTYDEIYKKFEDLRNKIS